MVLSKNKTNYINSGLLIIRVGLGLMFIYHGLPKLMGGEKTWEQLGGATQYAGIHFWPVMWGFLCAVVELFGGFLLILGLVFRPVCALLVVNLIVAVVMQLSKVKARGCPEPRTPSKMRSFLPGCFLSGRGDIV